MHATLDTRDDDNVSLDGVEDVGEDKERIDLFFPNVEGFVRPVSHLHRLIRHPPRLNTWPA